MPRWWAITVRTLSPEAEAQRRGVKSTASQRPYFPPGSSSAKRLRQRTAAFGETARAR